MIFPMYELYLYLNFLTFIKKLILPTQMQENFDSYQLFFEKKYWLVLARAGSLIWLGSARAKKIDKVYWLGSARAGIFLARSTPTNEVKN